MIRYQAPSLTLYICGLYPARCGSPSRAVGGGEVKDEELRLGGLLPILASSEEYYSGPKGLGLVVF